MRQSRKQRALQHPEIRLTGAGLREAEQLAHSEFATDPAAGVTAPALPDPKKTFR